jgi:small-conductance mechanosensitive channel
MDFKISNKMWGEIRKKSLLPAIIGVLLGLLYVFYVMQIKGLIAETWRKNIGHAFFTLSLIIIVYWLQRALGASFNWYKLNIASKTKTKLDDKFIPFFAKTTNVILWIIALIILLSHFGVNINALVAALGVSSLAIALAAQDTIANLIAGFLIMIDRPFKIGDRIKLPTGEMVEVLDIGVRRSKFLSEDKAIVIVPNLDLSKKKIVNYTYSEEESA